MSTTHAAPPASERLRAALDGRSLLHGPSQIFFQQNVWTGLLILAAFVVADWRMAVLAALGAVASTIAGALLVRDTDNVRMGMQGFCGALVGAAMFTALGGQGWAYGATLIGGILCAPVTWFFVWLFSTPLFARLALPATTAPFCTVAGILYVATISRHVESSVKHVSDGTGGDFLRSLLTNVSEVVLIDSIWAGALILLGLFIASWRVGLAAILGSVVGSVCALLLGEETSKIAEGLAGYSGVLTAIALSVVFLRSSPASWVYATIGAALTAVTTVLMNDVSRGPVYTWPYILTTWVLLAVAVLVPALRRP
jgi:urea transporter